MTAVAATVEPYTSLLKAGLREDQCVGVRHSRMEILDQVWDWLLSFKPHQPPSLVTMRLKPDGHTDNALMVRSYGSGLRGHVLNIIYAT